MTTTDANANAPSPEFTIELSGFMLFVKRALQVLSIWVLIASVIQSFQEGQPFVFVAGVINFCIYWAVAKYLIRTYPRMVSIEGDSIVFHKVPTAWIDINGIPIPLGITQRVVHQKSTIVLEWIGHALTLNDMVKGKSLRLAAGKHAEVLAAWFQAAGVAPPVGG